MSFDFDPKKPTRSR